jgi:hypothetical protein
MADPVPLERFEMGMSVNETHYACVVDPSRWRQLNAEHHELVASGYGTTVWVATHAGFVPMLAVRLPIIIS